MEEENGISTKEREVIENLEELSEKIVKLTKFLFNTNTFNSGVTGTMLASKRRQLAIMQEYASELQYQLSIWDLTEEQLRITTQKENIK